MNRFNHVAAASLLAALCSGGCTVAVEEDASPEPETVAEAGQELHNAWMAWKPGVVRIDFATGGWCGGALIAPNFLITSAHCLKDIPRSTHQGEFQASVRHFPSPDGERWLRRNATLYGFVKSDFDGDGDTEDDIAVVQSGVTWSGTTNADYLRLSLGTCSQIDRNDLYAPGYTDNAGNTDFQMRVMPTNIAWCGPNHFFDTAGSVRTCGADSGGPHIANTAGGAGLDVVVGLHSNHDPPEHPPGNCSSHGAKQRAVRLNETTINWIESAMGRECTEGVNNGHRYKKCF